MSIQNLIKDLVINIKSLFNHKEFITAAPEIIEAGNIISTAMESAPSPAANLLGEVVGAALNIAQNELTKENSTSTPVTK